MPEHRQPAGHRARQDRVDGHPVRREIALRQAGSSGGSESWSGQDLVDQVIDEYPVDLRGPGSPREWRLRHQLVPYGVIGMLWAGGAAAATVPGGWAVAAAALVTAVVWWCAWDRRQRANRSARRRWTTRIVMGGSAWLVVAATAGAGGPVAAALWLGGYAAAWPYWRTHRIPIPPEPVDEPASAPVVVREAPEIPRRWAERVAIAEGVLARSYLTDHTWAGRTETWTIQLDSIRHNAGTAISQQIQVGAALGQSVDSLTIDRHPSGALDRALLMITPGEDNPLRKKIPHPGPTVVYDAETGYGRFGIHVDDGPAEWAFYVPSFGLACGFMIGDPGSGKSALMTNLASIAAHTGVISVWGADPQGGTSMPQIINHCAWPATTEDEILRQLRAMDRAIDIRGALNGLRGVSLHVPTPQEPGVLLFLDEFHEVDRRGSEAAALIDKIVRKGRKVSVAIVGASQHGGLDTFGGLESTRKSLYTRNVAVLRSVSNVTKGLIPGLDVNPADIPETFPGTLLPTSGLGYLRGRRTAPFRGFWSADEYAEAMATAPVVTLDRVVANYIGEDYTGIGARRLAARAESAAAIAELDADAVAQLTATDPALGEALRAYQAQRGRGPHRAPATARPAAPPARATATGTFLRLTPAPRLQLPPAQAPTDSTAPQQAAAEPGQPPVLSTERGRRLYELIRAGVARTGELEQQSGYSETWVRRVLGELADAGLIHRVRHGIWEVTAAA